MDIGEGQRVPRSPGVPRRRGQARRSPSRSRRIPTTIRRHAEAGIPAPHAALPKTVVMSLYPSSRPLPIQSRAPSRHGLPRVGCSGEISLLPSDVIAPSESLLSSNLVLSCPTPPASVSGYGRWVTNRCVLWRSRASPLHGASSRRPLLAEIVRDRVSEVVGGLAPELTRRTVTDASGRSTPRRPLSHDKVTSIMLPLLPIRRRRAPRRQRRWPRASLRPPEVQ